MMYSIENRSKILITANSWFYIYNFRASTIKMLVEEGYSVTIFAFDIGVISIEDSVEVKLGQEKPYRSFLGLYRFLKKNPDLIVLSFNPIVNYLFSLLRKYFRFKLIVNVSGRGALVNFSSFKKQMALHIENAICSADYIFFQNNGDRKYYSLLDKNVLSKSEVIAGSGVDLRRFKRKASHRHKRKVVFLGRLLKEKGAGVFIDAALRFQKNTNSNNLEFELYGAHKNNNRFISLKRYASALNGTLIKYHGETDDVSSVLAECTCVCLPTRYGEGTPKSLLEGLASECLLITSDLPGCSGTIRGGNNGWMLNTTQDENAQINDLSGIFDVLSKLSDEKIAEMGRTSRELAEMFYDERFILKSYLRQIRKEDDKI